MNRSTEEMERQVYGIRNIDDKDRKIDTIHDVLVEMRGRTERNPQ